ncbi:MAG: GNAT family N-acetyltransferase [Rhodobacteraceae bacterium]|nr:GNAT family N-acetyltransferase [Paracoccaceae bacterium]
MNIEPGSRGNLDEWARMRAMFWDSTTTQDHAAELIHDFLSGTSDQRAFIALSDQGEGLGFAEISLRRDYVPNCTTSPVLFLEGIFVRPRHRRKGVARRLIEVVSDWGRAAGCTDFASDAALDNKESHAFHSALGFRETERVVYFHQPIPDA